MRYLPSSLLTFALLAALTGCASRQPPPVLPASPVNTVPLSRSDSARVRWPERVERFETGRYQDPQNPSIFHEGHPVYRVGQSATWRTDPLAGPLALPSPVGYSPPYVRPVPAAQSVVAETQRQRQLNLELQSALARVEEAKNKLLEKARSLQDNSAEIVSLRSQLDLEGKRVLAAQHKVQLLEDELARARSGLASPAATPSAPAASDLDAWGAESARPEPQPVPNPDGPPAKP